MTHGGPAAIVQSCTLDHDDHVDDSSLMSRAYPVHEAKAKLSEILRKVQGGRAS
jgi:hypothetical protein